MGNSASSPNTEGTGDAGEGGETGDAGESNTFITDAIRLPPSGVVGVTVRLEPARLLSSTSNAEEADRD